jgi:uncharacterized lipoprotein YddW (UPF0748 family)
MPYARAYYEAFQDWPSWISKGLVNFVTIMNYSVDPKEFEKWSAVVKSKVNDLSKVKVAIGAYRMEHSPEVFKQEFESCEKTGASCVIFHYGSIMDGPALKAFLEEGSGP